MTAAGRVVAEYPLSAAQQGAGGKIWARDHLQEIVDVAVGLTRLEDQGLGELVEIVRRDIGGHPHRDSGGAVDE